MDRISFTLCLASQRAEISAVLCVFLGVRIVACPVEKIRIERHGTTAYMYIFPKKLARSKEADSLSFLRD